MEVRFVSSLTSEDEERYAPALLAALTGLLGHTNLAYTLHIRTSGDRSFQHTHTAASQVGSTGIDPLIPSGNGNNALSLGSGHPTNGNKRA